MLLPMLVSVLTTQQQDNQEQYNPVPAGAHTAGPTKVHSKVPQKYSNCFIPASGENTFCPVVALGHGSQKRFQTLISILIGLYPKAAPGKPVLSSSIL